MKWKRREFLKIFPAAAANIFLSRNSARAMGRKFDFQRQKTDIFPKRTLGKTGQRVSIIGLGGLVVRDAEPSHAAAVVAEAIEKGINYFDVAPTYGDAELKLGPALKPYRDKVLLACKTEHRDRKAAEQELHNSLKRLQTDHFDVYQLHAISDVEKDVKAALSKAGAIQAFLQARKQGIIRYIGFSAHTPEAALAAMREFDFDTIMYPISFVCHYNSNFETAVLAEAKKQNMGIIAIKALAKQKLQNKSDRKHCPKCWYEPTADPKLAKIALSWAFDQGITVAIPPGEQSLYELAVELAPQTNPPTANQLAKLKKIASNCQPIFPT